MQCGFKKAWDLRAEGKVTPVRQQGSAEVVGLQLRLRLSPVI